MSSVACQFAPIETRVERLEYLFTEMRIQVNLSKTNWQVLKAMLRDLDVLRASREQLRLPFDHYTAKIYALKRSIKNI